MSRIILSPCWAGVLKEGCVLTTNRGGGKSTSKTNEELPFKPITEEELHSNMDIAYYVQIPEGDNTEVRDLAERIRERGFIARAVNTQIGRIVRILSDDLEMLRNCYHLTTLPYIVQIDMRLEPTGL